MNPPSPQNFKYLLPFMVLDAILRGFAMWRAARTEKKWWFIALFLVNSLGILPAVYLFINRRKPSPAPTRLEPVTPSPKLLASRKRSKIK